jgi:putative colanic acid biosynthesis acetyltransferase WcaF
MEQFKVDLSLYKNSLSRKNQLLRLLWSFLWSILVRPIPRNLFNGWKLFLLRLFGAKVHKTSVVYSSVTIYMPWNLEMDEYSCLAPKVDCYNADKIKIGAHSTISQKSFLCTASHDITKRDLPLVTAPIVIKDQVWIAANAFIGMGVNIGQGAVIGACAAIFKDVEPWTVVGGNPAKFIKKRNINE